MLKFWKWLWDSVVKPFFDTLGLKPLIRLHDQEQLCHEDEIARLTTQVSAPRNAGSLHTDWLAILRTLMNRYPSPSSSAHSVSPTSFSKSKLRECLRATTNPLDRDRLSGCVPFPCCRLRITRPNWEHHELCHFVLRCKPHNSEFCKTQANDTGH